MSDNVAQHMQEALLPPLLFLRTRFPNLTSEVPQRPSQHEFDKNRIMTAAIHASRNSCPAVSISDSVQDDCVSQRFWFSLACGPGSRVGRVSIDDIGGSKYCLKSGELLQGLHLLLQMPAPGRHGDAHPSLSTVDKTRK